MHKPSTTLRPAPHQDLIKQVQAAHVQERMEQAERRRLILEGDWRPLVWSLLWKYGYSDKTRDAVASRVKRSPNVALKALRKVALAYKIPPVRKIEGASKATQDAYRRVVLESGGLLTLPQRLELLMWGMNVVITVPALRRDSSPIGSYIAHEVLLPSNTEVVTPDENPNSRPVMSITRTITGAGLLTAEHTLWTILDDQAWTTYRGTGEFVSRRPHRAGVWPGTEWRRSRGDDYWLREQGEGLFDATLEASHAAARRDWHRQGQDHKREFLFADDLASIPHQIAGSDGAMEIPFSPNDATYQVLDPTISVKDHQDHIVALAREGADTMGIDGDLMDFQPGAESIEPLVAAQKHDDLMALRRSTIDYNRIAEKDNAWKTALILQGAGHPMASLLRPSVVMEKFDVQWSDLDFVDEPEARMRVLEAEVNMGLKSTIDAYMAQHPGISREDAVRQVRRIDEEEAERAEFLAKRNAPRLVRDRRSNVAELQGRIGGMVSGEARQDEDDGGDSERSQRTAGAGERRTGTRRTRATDRARAR